MNGLDQVTPSSSAASSAGSLAASPAEITDSAASYLPEPSSTGMGLFRDVLDTARGIAGRLGGVPLQVTGGLSELLETQMQFQMEMAAVNLVSNIERSKHEAKMSVIRNIRVS